MYKNTRKNRRNYKRINTKKKLRRKKSSLKQNFPIDVVWLNNEKRVVDVAKDIKPNTPYKAPSKFARYILELPEGTLDNKSISVGDLFAF